MFEFTVPTKVVFGEGVSERVGELTKQYGARVFLVADAQVMQDTGHLAKIKKILDDETYGVLLYGNIYSHSQADSNSDIVNRGADQARHAKCDVVLGFGGQTTLNIAKAIAFLVSNDGNLEDYFLGRKGLEKKVAYVEVPSGYGFIPGLTNTFYILDRFDKIKKSIETPFNYADLVICDPKLTTSIPGKISAYMGIDLLTMALETFISKAITPIADALSVKAIELIATNLAKSIQDPENIVFKGQLCTAGILTSIALANSTPGTSYSLSLALNSVFGLYRGIVNSIILPHVMEFNLTTCATKYVYIAKAFGEDVTTVTVVEAAIKAIEAIRKILSDLRTPTKLSELNIEKEELMQVAKIARSYDFMQYSPRPVSKDDLFNILNSSY